MAEAFTENEDFDGTDFTATKLAGEEYENCTFVNCNFANLDLSNCNFSECVFESCDLSMAKLVNTAFRVVRFKDCKLLGLHFESCNKFLLSMDFKGCHLNLSSFYQSILKKTTFKDSNLQEVDFTEADLSDASFENCDLFKAIFESTILQKTDFGTSYNYSIDPEINSIAKAKFSLNEVVGLLNKYNIVIE